MSFAVALGVSCGGSSDSSGGGSVQQADVDQIASSLADAVASVSSAQSSGLTADGTSPTNALVAEPRSARVSARAAVNHVVACPVDGHVTTTGNVFASCPTPPATGACTMSGAVTINFGDRTNNLNDCTYANGLIIDGSLFVTLSGTANGTAITLSESLTGSLSLNRKGPSGGLVPIDVGGLGSCFVFLTAKIPERTITGDVCGIAVNRTF
jgi:hypothetical protein